MREMKYINKIIKNLKSATYRQQLRRGFVSKGVQDLRRRNPRWLPTFKNLTFLEKHFEKEAVERVDRWLHYRLQQAKEKKKSTRRKRKVSKVTNYYR